MMNKIAKGLLILAILGYIISVIIKNALIYILCFDILVAVILFCLLVLAANLVRKLAERNSNKTCQMKAVHFNVIVLFCTLLFFVGIIVIDTYCLPKVPGIISLLSFVVMFVFVVLLEWSLIKRKWKTIPVCSIVLVLFIISLSFFNPSALELSKEVKANSYKTLGTLPYLKWVPHENDSEIAKKGVAKYDPNLAFDGLNLYASLVKPVVYLIDMYGAIVNTWTDDEVEMFEEFGPFLHTEMCRNGDLLIVEPCGFLVRLDWYSNVKWKVRMRIHHDVSFDECQNIYTLTEEEKVAFWYGLPVPILSSSITVLSSEGQVQKKIDVYEMIKKCVPFHRIVEIYRGILRFSVLRGFWKLWVKFGCMFRESGALADVMHMNSIEIMDRDIKGFCRKGDYLVSIRELDFIGIIDARNEKFVWSWGPGEIAGQHHPTLLKNGNVLIFDNGYNRHYRNFSRVIELNPLTKEIVWEYKSEPPEKFFSHVMGSCQRLPNGNTLIAESTAGYVFEVTKEGKTVWEFYVPEIDPKFGRPRIYRMHRITDPESIRHYKNCKIQAISQKHL